MSPRPADPGSPRRRGQVAVRKARLRRRRWLFAGGAVAAVAVVTAGALAVLRGPSALLPDWVDRALDLPTASGPSTSGPPPDVPDLTAVRAALVGAGPASVVLRSFDGGQLAKGSVALSGQGCDFDLTAAARRFVQAGGRLFAGLPSGGGWTDLTDVPASAAGLDRLAQLGLSDVTPYALAADPCRMLAIAATAGVVAESPDQGSFVLTLPGATIPGRDVLAATARRLVPGAAAQLTLEIDVDAAHHPTRIRAFSGGVFDCEAQFQAWGKGPRIIAPPSGAAPAPS